MRETAGRETELLAGELSQRMQVVTARLTEQVEHLVELAESNEAATEAARRAVEQVGDRDASRRTPQRPRRPTTPWLARSASSRCFSTTWSCAIRPADGALVGGRGGRGQGRRGERAGHRAAPPPPVAQPAPAPLRQRRRPPPPTCASAGRRLAHADVMRPRIGPPPPAANSGVRGPATRRPQAIHARRRADHDRHASDSSRHPAGSTPRRRSS